MKDFLGGKCKMKKGDKIYFLFEYHWQSGRIAVTPRANSKTVVVEYSPWGTLIRTRVKIEKVAFPNDKVCVVWELWRNQNSYRVERELYPDIRVPASQVSRNYIKMIGRFDETEKPL